MATSTGKEQNLVVRLTLTQPRKFLSSMKSQKICSLFCMIAAGAFASSTAMFGAHQTEAEAMDAEFKSMDANGDGKLTMEEHSAGAKKMFTMCDGNSDAKVTAAEMDASHAKMHGDKKMKEGMKSSAEMIKMMDTNADGMLTADEHAAGAKMMFGKMDTNKDNALSKSECEAGRAMMMKKEKSS